MPPSIPIEMRGPALPLAVPPLGTAARGGGRAAHAAAGARRLRSVHRKQHQQ